MSFERKLNKWLKAQRNVIDDEMNKLRYPDSNNCWLGAYRKMPVIIEEIKPHKHDNTACERCHEYLKKLEEIKADNKAYEDLSKKLAVFDVLLGENE